MMPLAKLSNNKFLSYNQESTVFIFYTNTYISPQHIYVIVDNKVESSDIIESVTFATKSLGNGHTNHFKLRQHSHSLQVVTNRKSSIQHSNSLHVVTNRKSSTLQASQAALITYAVAFPCKTSSPDHDPNLACQAEPDVKELESALLHINLMYCGSSKKDFSKIFSKYMYIIKSVKR